MNQKASIKSTSFDKSIIKKKNPFTPCLTAYNSMFHTKPQSLRLTGHEVTWFDDDLSSPSSPRCVYKVSLDCIMLEEDEDTLPFPGVVDAFPSPTLARSSSENR